MGIAIAAIFAVTMVVILGTYWLFIVRPEDRDDRALRKRLKTRRTSVLTPAVAKSKEQLSAVALLDRTLARWQSVVEPAQSLIIRSGLSLTIGTLVLACIFAGMLAALAILHFSSSLLLA